jgi:hypothetical protein
MYTGLDGPSAVSVGAQFGAGAGLRVKIGHRFGPVDAGFSIDGSSTPQYGLLVAAALVKAVKDRVIDPGTALQATHTLAFNPAFTVSWAPAAAFGITGSVGYLFNSLRVSGQSVSNSDQSSIQISAVADFDFGKVSSVPIAVLGGYRHNAPVGDNGIPAIDDITGGIFYSGIRELALGVEGGWRAFTLRPGTTVSLDSHVTVAQLSLQYYW